MNLFKNVHFFIVVLLFILGCTNLNEVPDDGDIPSGSEKKTTFVSVEQATDNLYKFMDQLSAQTRSDQNRNIAEVITLGGFAETRAAGATKDEPLVYLFNFADDEGFALVSGDSRVGDVLAFVEAGNLDPEVGTDNPGFAIFLSNVDVYYRLKTGLPVYDAEGNIVVMSDGDDYDPDIDEDYVEYSDWYDYYEWGEKIPCQWGQEYPLNSYCYTDNNESALVGCTAVAVAQIMYYHGYDYTYNGTAYDWDIIRNYQQRFDIFDSEAIDMAAKLVADLGRPENLDMDYGVSASGALSSNAPRTFRNFGYISANEIESYDNIGTSIRQRWPVYVAGNIPANNTYLTGTTLGISVANVAYGAGHAWVVDTILHQRRNIYTYRYDGVLLKTEYEQRELLHCNWGWWGAEDGYYFSGAFNPSAGPVLDSDSYTGTCPYNFAYNLRMITNIHP